MPNGIDKFFYSRRLICARNATNRKTAMKHTMKEYKDILIPRREDFSTILYFLRGFYVQTTHKQAEKRKTEVLTCAKVQQLITKFSEQNACPSQITEEKVREILDEIGYKFSPNVIRFLGVILTKICLSIYSGIFVNEAQLLKLKPSVGQVPVIFAPSHRSYGDFVLISFLMFLYDMAIPTTAAGMDFHGMKGMGEMLRKTGAFFMRRSYGQDQLYWDVFRQYVHHLVLKNDVPIQFFIEGTRSRTNKSLTPKIGLLLMTLKPLFTSEVPDILFVPINITYERILEEKLYAFELLGVPKPKESTSGLFKSLKIVKENFGNVYMNFGDPVSSKEWFHTKLDRSIHSFKPLHLQEIQTKEKEAALHFAQEIIYRQQKLCVLTTFNLIAIAITNSLTAKTPLTFTLLAQQVEWLKSTLEQFGAVVDVANVEENVKESLDVHKNIVGTNEREELIVIHDEVIPSALNISQVKGHNLSERTLSFAVPHINLQLYVNPVLHYLLGSMLAALVVSKRPGIKKDELVRGYDFLRSLFLYEFVISNDMQQWELDEAIKHSQTLNIITESNLFEFSPGQNEKLINLLNNLLQPFLFSYYTVATILLKHSDEKLQEIVINAKVQAEIEKHVFVDHIFVHPYVLSLDIVKNCLAILVQKKCINKEYLSGSNCYSINYSELKSLVTELREFVENADLVAEAKVSLKNKL